MSIVSSQVVEDHAQRDGRRAVREHHTDHLGVVHAVSYLAEAAADVQTALAARAPQITQVLADAEIARSMSAIYDGNFAAVTAQHATLADIRAAIRVAYQTETGERIGRLAGFLLTLTDAQLRTLFNMTQTQVNQLKTRLQSKVDTMTALLSLAGE